MKRGKHYLEARKACDPLKNYGLKEALEIVKKIAFAKFDETVDLSVNLGVDPKHADQMVRGTVSLPHGTGKQIRVLVITSGDKVQEAKDAGADYVGGQEMVEKIQKEGWLDFDKVVASPEMMKYVGRVGKILGPRGMMPNPKVGTVTNQVGEVVKALKKGQVEFRVDKYGIIHLPAGKVSFDTDKLYENVLTIIDALNKAKPASAKGTYMKKVTVSSTMGPGVRVDVNSLRADLEQHRRG